MSHHITDHQIRLKEDAGRIAKELAEQAGMTQREYLADLVEEIAAENIALDQVRIMRVHVITDKRSWRRAEEIADELGYRSISGLLDVRLRERAAAR